MSLDAFCEAALPLGQVAIVILLSLNLICISYGCRNVHLSSLPDKDHPEKAKRCEFVQGLIMSTIFDDDGL